MMKEDTRLLRKTMSKKQWKRMMAKRRSVVGRGMNTGTRTHGPEGYDRNSQKKDLAQEMKEEG